MKTVCILGSTGSIGCNSLEVIRSLNKNNFPVEVKYLSTNSKIDLLAEQIKEFKPKAVIIQNEKSFNEFKSNYDFKNIEVLKGQEGLKEIAGRDDYDLLINALVGFNGLLPTIEAIKSGRDVALSNKESLVVAGKLITELAAKNKISILPIDSEHSAILQCLTGENEKTISKIILTASGGPFLNKSVEEIRNCTIEDALNHPNWKMGNKITIDSATLMNKGLEVIEAKWLFKIDVDKIEVLIHPQSIIHSMVEFNDGSIKAQLGIPDMKIPIQYAITFPQRINSDYQRIDFTKNKNLTFEKPDLKKFLCLKLAYDALRAGDSYPVVLNAANEIAVELFLKGRIGFLQIAEIIRKSLESHKGLSKFGLEEILELDEEVRNSINKNFDSLK